MREGLALDPALMRAPPDKFTDSEPCSTESCTVLKSPSASVTDKPLMTSAVSSFADNVAGTAMTGGPYRVAVTLAANSDEDPHTPALIWVAVAVTTWPGVTLTPLSSALKLTLPTASVVTLIAPR